MKNSILIASIGIGIMGCIHIATDNTTDESASNFELLKYQSVLDSINEQEAKNPHLTSGYFLYDITGDSIPELWIEAGTCEADTELLVFTYNEGKVSQIYEGDGGHSDYFIFEGHLVSVMCQSGTGMVVTYEYDGEKVIDSGVEFSTRNEDGKALSDPKNSDADAKLNYWEDNSAKYIVFKHK